MERKISFQLVSGNVDTFGLNRIFLLPSLISNFTDDGFYHQ